MAQCANGQDYSQNSPFSQCSRLNFGSGDDLSTPVHALHANCGRNPRAHRLSKTLDSHRVQVLMHIMFAMQPRRSMPVMLLNAIRTPVPVKTHIHQHIEIHSPPYEFRPSAHYLAGS